MVKEFSDDPKKLMCDYDAGTRPPSTRELRAMLNRVGERARAVSYERSSSLRGWHVVVYLARSLEPAEQTALEAVLGSDLQRCGLDLRRKISVRRSGLRSRFWRARTSLLFSAKLV